MYSVPFCLVVSLCIRDVQCADVDLTEISASVLALPVCKVQ